MRITVGKKEWIISFNKDMKVVSFYQLSLYLLFILTSSIHYFLSFFLPNFTCVSYFKNSFFFFFLLFFPFSKFHLPSLLLSFLIFFLSSRFFLSMFITFGILHFLFILLCFKLIPYFLSFLFVSNFISFFLTSSISYFFLFYLFQI